MSLDYTRLKNDIKSKLTNDPDGKYGQGDAQPLDSNELEAIWHYVAKAIVEELEANAQTEAGIDVEDSNGNTIGKTKQSPDGIIT